MDNISPVQKRYLNYHHIQFKEHGKPYVTPQGYRTVRKEMLQTAKEEVKSKCSAVMVLIAGHPAT